MPADEGGGAMAGTGADAPGAAGLRPGAPLDLRGAALWPGLLDGAAQRAVLRDVLAVMAAAPPVHLTTRWGRPLSVAMTAAGAFGWTSDRKGYRYEAAQASGAPWPAIPAAVLAVWDAVAAVVAPGARAPDSCLVNLYRGGARMGLHQDRDEADLGQPVVSISLGDEALFRVGGTERGGPTASAWLRSGDVLALSGPARLAFHGVDRVREGSSSLVPGGGRINLTLRVVT